MIARVRGVIAAAILPTSILQVSNSTSTNTGFAPSTTIISAVGDEREWARDYLVARLQPDRHQRDLERVGPAAAGDAVLGPHVPRQPLLKLGHLGPRMNCPWSRTFWMRALIASRSSRYWVLRSMKSIGGGNSGEQRGS